MNASVPAPSASGRANVPSASPPTTTSAPSALASTPSAPICASRAPAAVTAPSARRPPAFSVEKLANAAVANETSASNVGEAWLSARFRRAPFSTRNAFVSAAPTTSVNASVSAAFAITRTPPVPNVAFVWKASVVAAPSTTSRPYVFVS